MDNEQLREVFLEEFRKRLKLGRKEIKTDPDLTASWSPSLAPPCHRRGRVADPADVARNGVQ